MEQTIGTCSLCGGPVRAHYGAWMSILPPPPPHCADCGAEAATHGPVIPMRAPSAPAFGGFVKVSKGTAGKDEW